MSRFYKLLISFFISIFIIVNTTFAYEIKNLNLMEIGDFVKTVEDTNLDKSNVSDTLVIKNKQDCDDKEETLKKDRIVEVQNIQQSFIKVNDIVVKNTDSEKQENKEEQEVKKEVVSLNDDQLYLLSKLVAAEARGESYQGQVAVAAVVLNRVQDSRFPDSIEDVIYQKNAFSVVKNGYIDIKPTEESYKAAKEALYGNDPTNDAIYFWNPDISTCSWINTLNPHLRIGNHVFAR